MLIWDRTTISEDVIENTNMTYIHLAEIIEKQQLVRDAVTFGREDFNGGLFVVERKHSCTYAE